MASNQIGAAANGELSEDAQRLLFAVHASGAVHLSPRFSGTSVQAGFEDFTDGSDRADNDRWLLVIHDLEERGLLRRSYMARVDDCWRLSPQGLRWVVSRQTRRSPGIDGADSPARS